MIISKTAQIVNLLEWLFSPKKTHKLAIKQKPDYDTMSKSGFRVLKIRQYIKHTI